MRRPAAARRRSRGAARWLLVPALLGLWSCRPERDAPESAPPPPPPVTVTAVARGDLREVLALTGTVEPENEAKVAARITGRIAAVHVENGDRVRRGDLLFELEDDEARIAEARTTAALDAARAQLKLVESGPRPEEVDQARERVREAAAGLDASIRELERARALTGKGALSDRALEDAETAAEAARARHAAAEKGLEMALSGARPEERELARARVREAEAALEAAREMRAQTRIASPIDGLVAARLSGLGEMVTSMPLTVMAVIIDTARVKVTAAVPEARLPGVVSGLPVEVRADALPGEVFAGAIGLVSPTIDPRSKTAEIEVLVPNGDGRLKAGMFVRLGVETARRDGVLVVPLSALVDGTVVVADGEIARLRPVKTGLRDGKAVEIVEGLAEGDLVVTAGNFNLADGAAISPRPAAE